jgi:hypothetical protein
MFEFFMISFLMHLLAQFFMPLDIDTHLSPRNPCSLSIEMNRRGLMRCDALFAVSAES